MAFIRLRQQSVCLRQRTRRRPAFRSFPKRQCSPKENENSILHSLFFISFHYSLFHFIINSFASFTFLLSCKKTIFYILYFIYNFFLILINCKSSLFDLLHYLLLHSWNQSCHVHICVYPYLIVSYHILSYRILPFLISHYIELHYYFILNKVIKLRKINIYIH